MKRVTAIATTALLLGLLADPALAQRERARDDVAESRRNAIVRAIEQVSPSVVSVNVVVPQRRPAPFDSVFWDFFYDPRPALRKVESIGTGFFFDDDGHILTNIHVLEEARYLHSVTLPDGRQVEAEFVGGDERMDLAVLKATGGTFPHAELGTSADLIIGEWVVAIGNPFGTLIQDPVPSVSVGVVSAVQRRLSPSVGHGQRLYQRMIQTDAAINPGNSGGPLVNAEGKVIGVNTMIFSPNGGNVGLGFAIPIDRARRVAAEIIEHGRRRDPWPGFRVQELGSLPRPALERQGIAAERGCLVVNIMRNAPAYEAGLRPGDVILRVNGEDITTATDIDFVVWDSYVGDTLTLTYQRDGDEHTIRFPIVELSR